MFLLVGITLIVLLVFLTYHAALDNIFILSGRLYRISAMLLTSVTIAYATIVFQTIAGNKILTPSLMGYEHLFVLLQVLFLLLFGGNSLIFQSKLLSFFLSAVLLICYSFVLYYGLFQRYIKQIYFILLIGLILGILFQTSTQFLQMMIDPNEFAYVQNAMFASLTRTSWWTLLAALCLIIFVFFALLSSFKYLDILALGRVYAMGLGVDYDRIVQKQLFAIAVLVCISTALIGPITFVGIFISNMTYRISSTSKHRFNIPIAIVICFILMVTAQFLIEHVFQYKHSLSVLINLLGGLYFIRIILKLTRK